MYKYFHHFTFISILGNGTLVINKSKATDEGQYLCKAKNGVGEGISKLAEVVINGKWHRQTQNIFVIYAME